jgi:hypothetical protein
MSINKTFPSLIKTINKGKGKKMSTSFTQEIALPSFIKFEVIINGFKEFIHSFKNFLEIRKRQQVKKTSRFRVTESSEFRKNSKSRRIIENWNIDETESFENLEDSVSEQLEVTNGEFNISSEVQEFSEEHQTANINSDEIANKEDEILIEPESNQQDQSANVNFIEIADSEVEIPIAPENNQQTQLVNANFIEIANSEVEIPIAPENNQQTQSANVHFDKEQETNNKRGRKSNLSVEEKNTLLDFFKKEKYPKSAQIENLADLTKQTASYIKNWFTRERKNLRLNVNVESAGAVMNLNLQFDSAQVSEVQPTSIQQVQPAIANFAEIANPAGSGNYIKIIFFY